MTSLMILSTYSMAVSNQNYPSALHRLHKLKYKFCILKLESPLRKNMKYF